MSQSTTTSSSHAGPVIEQRSIDYVPSSERRGKLWHQAPFWFTGNFVLPTMVVGFVGPQLGLTAGWSFLAIVLGACFGTFFMAFHANQGPRMGLPQMIQSRAQFGSRGAIVPLLATVFVYIGFMVFDVIVATQGLGLVLPDVKWFWYPLLTVVSIVIAVVGHDLLHFVQRWLTVLLVIAFAITTVLAFTTLEAPSGAQAGGWDGTAFLIQFSLAAGYNVSYAVFVSDYSRYLPEDSSAPKLILYTYLGAAASAVWLMGLGSLLASRISEVDAIASIQQTGDNLFAGFGTIVVLIAVLALISIMGVNAYGAMLTGVSCVDAFRKVRTTVSLRVTGLVVVGLICVVVALAIPDDYLGSFNNFVLLMLYFLIPWTAVNLVDFYAVRHGRYAIADILDPEGIYGRWSWRGLVAYGVGFVAMVPFFSLPGLFTGPIAERIGGADVSFAVGLTVSAVLYYVFCRDLDHEAETAARARSRRELEGSAG
ncbi:MAG: Cytosine/purine/uracil/thiamine/allantoin permease family protein [uncultured Nocardioides sp.]|uniref:Cytosine/purine/uracil/thiamine/allantoin permease family protein n=1 Tax=uncultured Nocardioides sp. TaxID=198441 RepID=A0A6J4NII2_9ACTN|nr:MAG: Cytosine/purine/uracil/thiamine/allantoin permease family protein [uncultured Nocardioides sp.]